MSIHELYGRLMEERQAEHDAHLKTISLLADLKLGKITLDQVDLGLDGTSWTVKPAQPAGEDQS